MESDKKQRTSPRLAVNFSHSTVSVGKKQFELPKSRLARLGVGALLVVGGTLGFLPILGFWMLPLGFLLISLELHSARKVRRKSVVWWKRRKRPRNMKGR